MPTAKESCWRLKRNMPLYHEAKSVLGLRKQWNGSAETAVTITLLGEVETLHMDDVGEQQFLKHTRGKY